MCGASIKVLLVHSVVPHMTRFSGLGLSWPSRIAHECLVSLLMALLHLPLQGVLLYGPPGTGKTLLARAVAHHTDCTFIRVSGSELVQKYIGEGSRMVRELFVMARYGHIAHT